jgi:HSP20 family protein
MSKEVWDPFEEMRRMQKEMNKIFENYKPISKGKELSKVREPISDIIETDKEVVAKIELPGVEKKDIHLNITDKAIEVKAQRSDEVEIKKDGYYRHERSYSGFQRAFALPAGVNPDKAVAVFKDGLLKVIIPKTKQIEAKKKKIEVK